MTASSLDFACDNTIFSLFNKRRYKEINLQNIVWEYVNNKRKNNFIV